MMRRPGATESTVSMSDELDDAPAGGGAVPGNEVLEPGLGMRRQAEQRQEGKREQEAFHRGSEAGAEGWGGRNGHWTTMVSMTSSLAAPLVRSDTRSLRSSRRCCSALGPCSCSRLRVRQ